MDSRRISLASPSSEMENLHLFNNSRVPVTPVEPIQPQTMPICEAARLGSQLGQVPWPVPNGEIHPPGFSPGTRAYGSAAACNNSYSYFNINQTNNWEEATHSRTNNFSTSIMDMERLNCLPFADLLALANNMGPPDTNLHADSNFSINSSSLMSMIGNTAAPDELHNGSCLPSEIACDLNFPPTVSEPGSTSKFFFTNLAPITPDHAKKTVINNQGVNDKSFPVPGGDNLGMGVTPVIDLGIDLNKTPNQKPKRRKHRPKVVREGQPKKTPKPVTPNKPPSTKRKYVRKNTTEKAAEGIAGITTPKSMEDKGKSSRRKLDFETENKGNGESSSTRKFSFNVESQAQNFSTRVESSSPMQQLEKETEITVEKTNANEIRLNEFSNKSIHKSTPRSPNGSNCSSNEYLTRGKQRIELEGGQYPTSDVAVPKGNNMTGVHYNSLHGYLAMLPMYPCDGQNKGINFPPICKRKRSEKVNCSPIINADNGKAHAVPYHAGFYTQKSNFYSPPQFTRGSSPSFQNLLINVQGGQPPPPTPWRMPFDHLWKTTKKRSKGSTKVRDMASLMGIALEKPQEHKSSHQLHTCMEALAANNRVQMKTKKRTRRPHANIVTNGFLEKGVRLTVDAVSEMLSRLDINKQSILIKKNRGKIVSYKVKKVKQDAIVLYQRDEKPSRAKVEIDVETNRVWKLLLENINSEGINGTDEEKVKWWEDERAVFQGRADSFIARMHLVQGDRRFSPWKGSVLDSVVGVFLTQNVSDHLSSSAFMSLAARFPFKSKIYPENHFEKIIPLVEEPEICIEDGENAQKWHKGNSSQPESTIGDHEGMYNTLPAIKEISEIRVTVESSIDDKRQQNDELSPQSSVVCSNNSVGSISHPAERLGPCLEVEADQTIMSNPNGIAHSASCVELIQKAGTLFLGVQRNEHNPEETMSYVQNHNIKASNSPNLSLHPAFPSRNMYPQMTSHFEAEENEYLKTADIESTCHNISRKSGENCRSEPSAITEESVHLHIGVDMMPETIYEASRSRNENNHNNSCEGKLNNMHYHQYMPVWDINYMDQPAEEQHSNHRQQVLEVQSLQKDSLPISESTSAINDSKNTGLKAIDSGLKDHGLVTGKASGKIDLRRTSKTRKGRTNKKKEIEIDWDILRKDAQCKLEGKERSANTMNTVDWEAVRCANVNEIADTIKERGMNNMLAQRIQEFLNRLVKDHGSTDLEWLREVPPDKAKEYLLSVKGLGLKSVECVRLLTLHQLAFPVDTNVGRIAVRLGWVPIQPLPESLQLHLLEMYPVLESIQKYLWPRLCKLDQRTLYELHYQMITFGKVFCSKSKPNCNACPMRGECRHFASAFASARLSLPAPEEMRLVSTAESKAPDEAFRSAGRLMNLPPAPDEAFRSAGRLMNLPLAPPAEGNPQLQVHPQSSMCEPIVEVPASPEPTIEVPSTPEPEFQKPDDAIEDSFSEDPEEIPTIRLNLQEFTNNLQNYMQQKMELIDSNMSKALVALTPEAASIPTPKLKNVSRLRTEHQVYELPDSHHLLEGLDKREPDDPCSYMLAIWTPGETPNSIQPPESRCNAQESGGLCNEPTCFSCNSIKEANSQIVRGTILIPCRTAMRGSFPLNGTYFQVNEVFADHASSLNPINIPRDWIWNLPRRTVYFGTSIPSIFKGLSTQSIQQCFWRGFVCVRGFDQKTRSPRPLIARLHFPASKSIRPKGKSNQKQELPTSNS